MEVHLNPFQADLVFLAPPIRKSTLILFSLLFNLSLSLSLSNDYINFIKKKKQTNYAIKYEQVNMTGNKCFNDDMSIVHF